MLIIAESGARVRIAFVQWPALLAPLGFVLFGVLAMWLLSWRAFLDCDARGCEVRRGFPGLRTVYRAPRDRLVATKVQEGRVATRIDLGAREGEWIHREPLTMFSTRHDGDEGWDDAFDDYLAGRRNEVHAVTDRAGSARGTALTGIPFIAFGLLIWAFFFRIERIDADFDAQTLRLATTRVSGTRRAERSLSTLRDVRVVHQPSYLRSGSGRRGHMEQLTLDLSGLQWPLGAASSDGFDDEQRRLREALRLKT